MPKERLGRRRRVRAERRCGADQSSISMACSKRSLTNGQSNSMLQTCRRRHEVARHRLGNVCKGVRTMANRRDFLTSLFGAAGDWASSPRVAAARARRQPVRQAHLRRRRSRRQRYTRRRPRRPRRAAPAAGQAAAAGGTRHVRARKRRDRLRPDALARVRRPQRALPDLRLAGARSTRPARSSPGWPRSGTRRPTARRSPSRCARTSSTTTARRSTPSRSSGTSTATATTDGSARKGELAPVASVEVVDPSTVSFNLKSPFSPLLSILVDRAGHDGLAEGGRGRRAPTSPARRSRPAPGRSS